MFGLVLLIKDMAAIVIYKVMRFNHIMELECWFDWLQKVGLLPCWTLMNYLYLRQLGTSLLCISAHRKLMEGSGVSYLARICSCQYDHNSHYRTHKTRTVSYPQSQYWLTNYDIYKYEWHNLLGGVEVRL